MTGVYLSGTGNSKHCVEKPVYMLDDNLCDREPERENEVMILVERHVRRFFAVDEKKRERE